MSITYYGKALVSYYISWLFLYKSYNEIVVTKIVVMSYIILYEKKHLLILHGCYPE